MAANRVKSKNLFNFRPAGLIDADILDLEKAMMEKMGCDMNEMIEKMQALSDVEFGVALQGMMGAIVEQGFNHPIIAEVRTHMYHNYSYV